MTAVPPAPAPAGPEPAPARFHLVEVADVALELPGQHPVVTLQELEPPLRELAFPVGLPEGGALAAALRRLPGPRPLTHELFASVLARTGVDVVAVRLVGRRGGTYLAELDLTGPNGRQVLDCRPTDGLTLVLRLPVPAPVLADERLFDEEGDVDPA